MNRRGPRGINIREVSFDDYRGITLLESQYGLETKSYEEWTHLWDGNPACKERLTIWPKGWVLETDGKRVVGYLGNVPLSYQFEDQRIIAAAGHAWVVDPGYRNYAMLLLDAYFKQRNVDLYLCTSANRQSSGILSMFNSSRVPVGAWDRSIFWITHHGGFAASWITMKGVPLRRFLSCALSAALLKSDLSAKGAFVAKYHGGEVEFHEVFDERFDLFWETLRRQKSRSLLAVRSREVLQWHFKYSLLKNEVWILTITKGSGLAAYSIFCRQDNPKFGLKRVRMVDFQALNGKTALLLPMLRYALARCREEGIHMLEYIGVGPDVRNIAATLRPYQRKLPSWLYYYTAANQTLASRLKNPEIWNPSCFDGDSSL
jgi:hypothetical protein